MLGFRGLLCARVFRGLLCARFLGVRSVLGF